MRGFEGATVRGSKVRGRGFDGSIVPGAGFDGSKVPGPPTLRIRGSRARIPVSGNHIDEAYDAGAEDGIEAMTDDAGRAFDLALPGGILRAHLEHAVAIGEGRHLVQRRADRHAPGERDLLVAEWRLAQDGGDGVGDDLTDAFHVEAILPGIRTRDSRSTHGRPISRRQLNPRTRTQYRTPNPNPNPMNREP